MWRTGWRGGRVSGDMDKWQKTVISCIDVSSKQHRPEMNKL